MNPAVETAVARLSQQLGLSREEFVELAVASMIPLVDSNIALGWPPFTAGLPEDFECSEEMGSLTSSELRDLADLHPIPQRALRIRRRLRA